MANWDVLKSAIADVIKTNGNQAITGQLLQNVLNSIVSSVGENATFAGIATAATNPGAPDGPVFYLATEAGVYANFSGVELLEGEAVILQWDNGAWIKKVSGFATQKKLAELGVEVGIIYDEKYYPVNTPMDNILQFKGKSLHFKIIPKDGSNGAINLYDQSGAYITSITGGEQEVTIPTSAAQAIVKYGTGIIAKVVYNKMLPKNLRDDFDELQDDLDELQEQVTGTEANLNLKITDTEANLNLKITDTEANLNLKAEVYSSKIFSKKDWITGKYNTSGDTLTEQLSKSVNQIIDEEAKEGDIYTIRGYGAVSYHLWAFVDSSNNILSKAHDSVSAVEPITIKAPAGTAKAIFSSYANNFGRNFAVSKNPIYGKENEKLKSRADSLELKITDTEANLNLKITDTEANLNLKAEVYSSKIFSRKDWITGKYNTSGDTLTEQLSKSVNQIIDEEAKEGDIYTIRGYGAVSYHLWAFVDSSNNILSKAHDSVSAVEPITIKAPAGTAKAIFSSYANNFGRNFAVSKNPIYGIKLERLSSRIEELENTINNLQTASPLLGKKAYFCGDSIMAGSSYSAEKRLPGVIQSLTGCTSTRLAIDGSLFYDETWYVGQARSILWQVKQIPTDADYIIIQGGVNGVNMTNSSAQNYAPMGEITDSYTSEFNAKSQIGCLEAICKYLYDNFPKAKIGFIITYQIGGNYSDYLSYWKKKIDAFLPVLEKWGIPVLDWRETGINLAANAKLYGIDTWASYEEFSSEKNYDTDDKVLFEGAAYKANEPIAAGGVFNPEQWTKVTSTRYDTWHVNELAYQLLGYKTAKWMETL